MCCTWIDGCTDPKPQCGQIDNSHLTNLPFCYKPKAEATESSAPSGQTEFDLLSVGDRFEKAEHEILKVCKKYNIGLAPKYDDGVAVVMCASEPHEGGGTVNHEREIDT